MTDQHANIESYITRLRKPCGVPPFIQREVAALLEGLLERAAKTPIDQRRIDHSEESLEAAFWEFDARRKSKEVGERFAFKQAIRKRFPQWFESCAQDSALNADIST